MRCPDLGVGIQIVCCTTRTFDHFDTFCIFLFSCRYFGVELSIVHFSAFLFLYLTANSDESNCRWAHFRFNFLSWRKSGSPISFRLYLLLASSSQVKGRVICNRIDLQWNPIGVSGGVPFLSDPICRNCCWLTIFLFDPPCSGTAGWADQASRRSLRLCGLAKVEVLVFERKYGRGRRNKK